MAKPDFQPLLLEGLHPHDIGELRNLCVDGFPLSSTRPAIMEGLENVVGQLKAAGIRTDIWVDGSFVTEKIDPSDVDLLIRMDHNIYDDASDEQRKIIDNLANNPETREQLFCEVYLHFNFPEGHEAFWHSEYFYAYWLKQYGFGHDEYSDLKGIAVLTL